jgi:tetratricopeptide (TPR) repeat protein
MKHLLVLILFCQVYINSLAQENFVVAQKTDPFNRGLSYFENGLFEQALASFSQVQMSPLTPEEKASVHYYRVLSEIYLFGSKAIPSAISQAKHFIPSAHTDQTYRAIGDYYFKGSKYREALEYYGKIQSNQLSEDLVDQIEFNQAYSLFILKDFETALNRFNRLASIPGEHYYPANYYQGLCHFYNGDYDWAIAPLRIAESDQLYDAYIPYYLSQIYFVQGRYDELMSYAVPILEMRGLRNKPEIHQLLGQSLFEQKKYVEALPYLEYYASEKASLNEKEFYQLGFTQYQTGHWENAITSFKELASLQSLMGQNALFYLADCYLKTGDKLSAKSALALVKGQTFDLDITEEATFNYGKISYELNDPNEALTALQSIQKGSPFYEESMKLMGIILLNTKNYQKAIEVLQGIPDKNEALLQSYHQVLVFRALQLLQDNDQRNALQLFNEALNYPGTALTQAVAYFWLGDIAYQNKRYEESIQRFNQFLKIYGQVEKELPNGVHEVTARYAIGFNQLKLENYNIAIKEFQVVINLVKSRNNEQYGNLTRDEILGDVLIKTGDAYFKKNQYADAVKYYDQAIDLRRGDFVYAIYQKAIIEGLRGRNNEKIKALRTLVQNYPNAPYVPDALYSLGAILQESGQLQEAIAPLRTLVFEYKGKTNLTNGGLLRLGLISYNLGQLEASVAYYKEVFENNPEPEEISQVLSSLEEIYVYDLGQPNEYVKLIENLPGYSIDDYKKDSINFRTAEIRYENADYKGAISGFTSYLNNFPQGTFALRAHFIKAECHSLLKQFDQALSSYDQVVSRGPSTYYQVALKKAALIAYNHAQDFSKSLLYYQSLENLANGPEDLFDAQLGAMQSAYRSSSMQAARQYAEKVVNHPSAKKVQKNTANFYLGKMAYDEGAFSEALNYLDQLIANSDNEQTAEARYLRASIYYQSKQYNKAKELCINANKESSAYPYWVAQSVILLSDIFAVQGDLYNARAALEALLENYNGDSQLIRMAEEKLNQINEDIERGSRLNNLQEDPFNNNGN